jgi:glutamine amidotransferase
MSLVIIDPGYGNVGSVRAAFERLGAEPSITSDRREIADAERLVLPGVGSAGFAIDRLNELGLIDIIRAFQRPLLGICLGMQLMFDWSEEGETPCLGLVGGKVRRLEPLAGRRVPHMGWSRLSVADETRGIGDGDYLWFANSFVCDDGPHCFARADDAGPIPAALARGNLLGCQFHPERSGKAGARFLQAFLEL